MKRYTYLGDNNYYGIVIKFLVGFISAMLGYMEVIIFENIDMFRAISFVVFIDFVFGVIKAIKFGRFRVNRAMKVVYYLVSYWMILFVVLSIEKSHSSAFFFFFSVSLPITIFPLFVALKNASLIGAIPQGLLLKILESIDKHKENIMNNVGNSNEPPDEDVKPDQPAPDQPPANYQNN